MAFFGVKSRIYFALFINADGQLRLVAIAVDLLGKNHRFWYYVNLSDAGQTIGHPAVLYVYFLVIGNVAEGTSSAFFKNRAIGKSAVL